MLKHYFTIPCVQYYSNIIYDIYINPYAHTIICIYYIIIYIYIIYIYECYGFNPRNSSFVYRGPLLAEFVVRFLPGASGIKVG